MPEVTNPSGSDLLTTLPMNDMKQSAILGHLLTNQNFFLTGSRKIKSNWFRHPYHSKIYTYVLDLYNLIGRFPTLAELKTFPKLGNEDQQTRDGLFRYIDKSIADAGQIGLDAIKPELIDWLHSKILYDSMSKSAQLWNKARSHDSAIILEQAVRDYHEAKFEEGIEVRFDNISTYIPQIETQRQNCITTGLRLLDEALLDGATSGGMKMDDTTVILAPVNIGKTTTMLTIAAHNILAGKDVFVMSHEGSPDDIRFKLLKSVMDASEAQILAMYKSPEGIQRLQVMTQYIQKHCVYIPYNKAGMVVEDVIPIIRTTQERRCLQNQGKGFDLFVCDYPAKLGTAMASKGNLQTRHIQDIVYEAYVQLALEYHWHSLVAIQTNREGSKVNKHQNNNNRLLTREDVMETWGVMASASNVITLNRSPSAEKNNRITYYVDKSRSNQTGIAVCARTNFSHARTHSNEMGAVSYIGTKTLEETIDNYLLSMPGQRIPDELVRSSR